MTTYNKNEYVRYASNGVCLIADKLSLETSAESGRQEYYLLKPVCSPASTIYVPLNNAELMSRMRYLLTKEDIDGIIASANESDFLWIDDRRTRVEYYNELLKHSKQDQLLRLVSCIYLRKQALAAVGKKLSMSDEGMLKHAEKLVEDEFSFVLGIPASQVSAYIRERLGTNRTPAKT